MSSDSEFPALPALPDVDTGAPIATNADRDPYVDDEGKPWIPVAVGDLAGHYSVHLHKVVASDGRIYTPTGFECAGGKENNRKWRLSLRVLLSNGQRGSTLGYWLAKHNLEHLVPQVTPRRAPAGSGSGSGSGGRPGSSSAPSSEKRTSPEKRQRAPAEVASPDASPTKQLRRAFVAASLGAGAPVAPMPRPSAPDSPPAADVIGVFMGQPLAAAATAATASPASRRGLFPAGAPAPRQLTPAQALALEGLHRGSPIKMHPAVTSGGASGPPIFPSRVIGGGPGDDAMLTPPVPREETALGAPRPRPRHPTPIPSAADVAAALAHSHRTYGITAPGATDGSPAHSTGVRLPPRQNSGSSLDLARVFDYEDGLPSPGGGGGGTVSPGLGSSPRRGGAGGRDEGPTDWGAVQSITLALGGPLDGGGGGGGLAGIFPAPQDPKHSDGSSLSNGRSHMAPLQPQELGFLLSNAAGDALTDKAAAVALGLPLVAPDPADLAAEEAAKAASIGSSSQVDKDPGGRGVGAALGPL